MSRRSSVATRINRQHRPTVVGPVGNWSNPATWGSSIPGGGEDLIISTSVVLDCDTQDLGNVTITGTVTIDPTKSINLRAKSITVAPTGAFLVGTAVQPYAKKATITLTGKRADAATAVRYAVDYEGRTGAGDGEIKRVSSRTGASAAEDFIVTWSSATAFSVTGSVSGALGSGTVGTIFNNKVRFIAVAGSTPWAAGNSVTLRAVVRGFSNNGLPRSFQVQPGGKARFFGDTPAIVRAKINGHLSPSDRDIALADPVNWAKQDKVVIGPTDFYGTAQGASQSLYLTATAVAASISVAGGMGAGRWGLLQYAVDAGAGVSLAPGTLTNSKGIAQADWDLIPKVLDERAPVINLTRNIVIQGADDGDWETYGFGAHCMFMGLSSEVQFDGVEFRRMGQAGSIGRYPFHWHMLSYNMPDGMNLPSDGTFIGAADPTKHFIRNCAIHQSSQRAIVVHGTHGVVVHNNVCYDIRCHAVFLEDGVEQNNWITDNTVMKVRAPLPINRLLDSDEFAAGFWFSNPTNTLTGNWASDCVGNGIWNVFGAVRCFGLCYDVPIVPNKCHITLHQHNVTHSTGREGMQTEMPPQKNNGFVADGPYLGDSDTVTPPTTEQISFHTNYKSGGYRNRIRGRARYNSWVAADNVEMDFFGSVGKPGFPSFGEHILNIGESLNNATSRKDKRRAFASYHEGLNFRNGLVINYPAQAPTAADGQNEIGGGMISLHDLYLQPIFRFNEVVGMKLVNSHSGVMCRPPHIDGTADLNRHWSLAGAIWDVNGNWTTAGKYMILDHPFLTYQAANLTAVTGDTHAKSTDTLMYGFTVLGSNFGLDPGNTRQFWAAVTAERLDTSNNVVATWAIPDGATSWQLGIMRPFVFAKGGRYKITFPVSSTSSFLNVVMHNASLASDNVLIALQWTGSVPVGSAFLKSVATPGNTTTPEATPTGYEISSNRARMLTPAGNLATVEAGAGDLYWQDTANNLVWIKYVGGLVGDWPEHVDIDAQFLKRISINLKV